MIKSEGCALRHSPRVVGVRLSGLCGLDVDELATVATFAELYSAADEGIESVVLADTDIQTGMVHCAALTFENVAGFGELAAEDLNTQTFAF